MNLWFLNLQLLWTLTSVLRVFSVEVTVTNNQLMLCKKNKHLCVTKARDCDLRPPDTLQKTLNMTCFYQEIPKRVRSVTCSWSQEASVQPDASLIFSRESKILFCRGVFNPVSKLNVSVRMKDYRTGREIWSQPHPVFLFDAVKPLRSILTVLGSTEDSLVVSWNSSVDGGCRLRYRLNKAPTWTQIADVVSAHADQNVNYTIRNLLPFNVYTAAVACRGESGFWSDWSSGMSGRTLDRVPSRPSELCYRVENKVVAGSVLHLRWKAPDLGETEGRVLGYQVSLSPPGKTLNVSETSAQVEVEEENHSVAVRAFNTAGLGPAALLQISTQNQITLPSLRNLWISSCYPKSQSLLVQWASCPSSSSAVSHVVVEWSSETRPSTRGWTRVDGFTTSYFIIQDVDPEESYLISVFPVHLQLCGPPQSLTASLQQGALMEAISLRVVSVTKTTVTIMWAWQLKSEPIRVESYRAVLRRDSHKQTVSLWPDQLQHTFFNLTPNTEYSVLLQADNVSRSILTVSTYFDEAPAVATATPLLLLTVTVVIISILSRTVYKSYFFPYISSPRLSSTGQWLMNPNPEDCAEKMVLDMKDLEVTDVLKNKSLVLVGPNDRSSPEELNEDVSPRSIGGLGVQTLTFGLSVASVIDAGPIRAQQLLTLQSYGHVDTDLVCEMDYLTNIRTQTEETISSETN
ncbi:interleukin-6 receptor subunit beta [Austrofundulus limnaeus]|uniref:Interleukin-6 receptor subunit beta n=1 Tax=Austrofundulus limnaeus TaxID=52670 RepID=A0A2I4BQT9_AUSLI|nr:PREDICTED: interleukin-6 receptor subunit beta-like [Austrofundulus limnaeus]